MSPELSVTKEQALARLAPLRFEASGALLRLPNETGP